MGVDTIYNSKIEQNKLTVRKFYEDVMNKGKLDVLHQIFHPNFQLTEIDDTETSYLYHREGARIKGYGDIVKGYIDGFSDLQCKIITLIGEENVVLVHWVFHATHEDHFLAYNQRVKRSKYQPFIRLK